MSPHKRIKRMLRLYPLWLEVYSLVTKQIEGSQMMATL